MRHLQTPLGEVAVHDERLDDARVGICDIETVENRGPESTFRWSLDLEEAIFDAAREVGVVLVPLVPGGWRVQPATALDALAAAVARRTAGARPTGRKTTPA